MKKIIIIIFFSISLLSCSYNKITSFIGNEFISNEMLSAYNTDFYFKKIESKSLLKIIEEDMTNQSSKLSIRNIIRKSDRIILSIGLFDLLKCVYLEEDKLKFNFKLSILELFELNLFNIVEQIYEYNPKVKLTLVSLYNPYINSRDSFYLSFNIGVEKFNQVIKSFSLDNNISYYDINRYSLSIKEFNKFDIDSEKQILEGLITLWVSF